LVAIPVLTSDLSPQNFQIALDVILTLGAVGLIIVLTRNLGKLCLFSHPLLMNSWKLQDRIAAAIMLFQFGFLIFAMVMTGAWPTAIVALLLIASIIYSIRGSDETAVDNLATDRT